MFIKSMKSRIKNTQHRILYTDGSEPSVLQAAAKLRAEKLVAPILLGKLKDVRAAASNVNVSLEGIEIIDPQQDGNLASYTREYYHLRKDKGMTEEKAEATMRQPNYFGAMMVRQGDADGLVGGLKSDTKPFIPAFEIIQLRKGYNVASSVFVLEWTDRLLFFADCAVNINPTAEELSEIAFATIETVKWLEVEPRVAFLSFSSYSSAQGDLVDKVKEAVKVAQQDHPEEVIDGEIQFDAAFLPAIAKLKAPKSPFAESGANVFIFPDLNSGNIAYKITERLGRARATGPVLQGLNKPVNDVSRGASVDDLVNAGIITAALVHT